MAPSLKVWDSLRPFTAPTAESFPLEAEPTYQEAPPLSHRSPPWLYQWLLGVRNFHQQRQPDSTARRQHPGKTWVALLPVKRNKMEPPV